MGESQIGGYRLLIVPGGNFIHIGNSADFDHKREHSLMRMTRRWPIAAKKLHECVLLYTVVSPHRPAGTIPGILYGRVTAITPTSG